LKLPLLEYAAPKTIEEAIELLARHDGEAKVLSGGQSLMPMLAFRLAAPKLLVDLRHVRGLNDVVIGDHGVELGAKLRWCDIETHVRLAATQPLLRVAVGHVAHYQIRNRGTLGGSLAHADPAAELPAIAVTCEAGIVAVGPRGRRVIPASEFFIAPLVTALAPDEIIVALRLPAWPARRRYAFEEFARRRGDFALAGVALFYDETDERIANAHVGAFGIGDVPMRLPDVEGTLNGQRPGPGTWERAVAAAGSIESRSDLHADADYRRALFGTLLGRALQRSAERSASMTTTTVRAVINGVPTELQVPARMTLADALREKARLTGTHLGCEHGVCGACTVIVDDLAVRSCLMLAVQADGSSIVTVEGLAPKHGLSALQVAFRKHHALQCGFCTPGILTTMHALLRAEPDADEERIREVLGGNLCRCTGYIPIIEAVLEARTSYRSQL
jgi:carbon-monoxide dehydrogenase medium subunit